MHPEPSPVLETVFVLRLSLGSAAGSVLRRVHWFLFKDVFRMQGLLRFCSRITGNPELIPK
jgi:hypothetical protein